MNSALIHRWNSKIQPNDIVYHLGDVGLCSKTKLREILKQLNGRIHLIIGNHDHDVLKMSELFASVQAIKLIQLDGQQIFLSHYAHRVWPNSHRGSWHLYGHSHGTLFDDPNSLSFDVGVDCHNYYPLSLAEIAEIMKTKTFKPVDHHGEQ